MRVPVSCQIYPPPVSVDAALLPPLTDAQAPSLRKMTFRSSNWGLDFRVWGYVRRYFGLGRLWNDMTKEARQTGLQDVSLVEKHF